MYFHRYQQYIVLKKGSENNKTLNWEDQPVSRCSTKVSDLISFETCAPQAGDVNVMSLELKKQSVVLTLMSFNITHRS